MVFYDVVWFIDHDDVIEDMFDKQFDNLDDALRYYEEHKNDKGKYGWKVTKRGHGFKILKYYVREK